MKKFGVNTGNEVTETDEEQMKLYRVRRLARAQKTDDEVQDYSRLTLDKTQLWEGSRC